MSRNFCHKIATLLQTNAFVLILQMAVKMYRSNGVLAASANQNAMLPDYFKHSREGVHSDYDCAGRRGRDTVGTLTYMLYSRRVG